MSEPKFEVKGNYVKVGLTVIVGLLVAILTIGWNSIEGNKKTGTDNREGIIINRQDLIKQEQLNEQRFKYIEGGIQRIEKHLEKMTAPK